MTYRSRLAWAVAAGLWLSAAATAQQPTGAPARPAVNEPDHRRAPPAAGQPLLVKVSADKPLSISTGANSDPPWLKMLIAAFPSLVALIVVWLGNRQSAKNSSAALAMAGANAEAGINQKANEFQIDRIDRWLSEFFGPFMQLSEENKRIAELIRSRQPDPAFRTLHALLDPEWKKSASATDLNLISRIVGNGVALRTLIREKAGPTDPALSQYLSRAAAHFSILELADAGAITERTEDFGRYVYPRQLDPVLDLERRRLEARREELLSNLSTQHFPGPALVIPAELALEDEKVEAAA